MSDPKPEQGTHFWFMAFLMTAEGGRPAVGQFYGTHTPREGETRFDAFEGIRNDVYQRYPETVGAAVITFDIQPNKL